MTALTTGSLITWISWRAGSPALVGVAPTGAEHRQPLRLGAAVGWRVSGDRRCTGIRLPEIGEARPCPVASTVPPTAVAAQCATCAATDPGRAVARNFSIDDPRQFALYLAWFGDHLLKIGLTATERGTDRLLEQGALAFTWLARGSFRAARRLEHTAAATGVVPERVGRRAKLATWWEPPGDDAADSQLAAAHRTLTTTISWPDGLHSVPCEVQHLAAAYGITEPLRAENEVTALDSGAVLTGDLACLAGHDALLVSGDRRLLIDLRLLTGWTVTPATGPTGRIRTTPLPRRDASRGTQGTLF